MDIKVIKTEAEYTKALSRLDKIFHAPIESYYLY